MLAPISEISKQFFAPIRLSEKDRLAISLDENENFVVTIYAAKDADGSPNWPSRAALRDFPLRIPERKQLDDDYQNRGEQWQFGGTDITASLIAALWKPEQLSFKADAKAYYDYLLLTAKQLNQNAEIVANFRMNKTIPENELQFCADLPLAPYQQLALHNAYFNEGYALFMKQGTGKTPVAIACIDNEAIKPQYSPDRMAKILVVAPNNVRQNWVHEIQNFSTVDGKVTVLRGDQVKRTKLLIDAFTPRKGKIKDQYTVVIVGYDILNKMEALLCIDWDMVILDESHYAKSAATKRWEALQKLREKAKRRYILTGTPYGNSIVDMYTQLEFIRKGGSGFTSLKDFKDFYCVYENGRIVAQQNLPFIQERLAQMSFFVSKEEAMPDMPAKTFDIIEADMSAHQAEIYRQVMRNLYVEIQQDLENANSLTINNILTKLLRLAQIASGYVSWDAKYDDDGNVIVPRKIERFKEQRKIDAIVEEFKAKDPTEKMIIWSCWTENIHALAERFEKEGIEYVTFYGDTSEADRKEAERKYNFDDNCRVFIGNPAAGGTGLNLLGYPPQHPELSKCDTTHIIFMSQNWSSLQFEQASDRGHRRGTRRPVRISNVIIPETIDYEIYMRVLGKQTNAIQMSDLKEILGTVLGK